MHVPIRLEYYVCLSMLLQVVQFVSEPKPWNFHYAQHESFEKNFDILLFYKWIKLYRATRSVVNRFENMMKYIHGLRDDICDSEANNLIESKSNSRKRFPIEDKFSVILSTYDRPTLTTKMVDNYLQSKLVEHIFVIWHNPNTDPPIEMEKTSVTILKQRTDSLNNKLNPIPKLRTKAILMAGLSHFTSFTCLIYLLKSSKSPF